MSDKSKIEWTDATWNPIRGCTRVSPGCGGPGPHGGCYAEAVAARFSHPAQGDKPAGPYHGLAEIRGGKPRWTGEVAFVEEALTLPLRWSKPRRIFVNSMSDLFHESAPWEWVDRIFAIMALCPQHTFQVLTKRADRMRSYMRTPDRKRMIAQQVMYISELRAREVGSYKGRVALDHFGRCFAGSSPFPNIWLGVSVEDQRRADERIPDLLVTPAAVRWISAEPLLSRVEIDRYLVAAMNPAGRALDWVVVGGESGPRARPMNPQWAQTLRDQCADAGVPFLFKQWGEYHTTAYNMATKLPVFRQFSHFEQWVNKASTWINGGVCIDTSGRILKDGADFMRARDEGTFPVTIMQRVGKKRAGRQLDGVMHDAYPAEPGAPSRNSATAGPPDPFTA